MLKYFNTKFKVFFVLLNIILLITKINFSFGKIKLSKIN